MMFIKDPVDPKAIQKEREKAKALRKSGWWKNILGKGLCEGCGGHFRASELTMDHKIALSRGGKTTKGNVQPFCKPCNNQKRDRTPVELILDSLNVQS